jgi:hemolysin III
MHPGERFNTGTHLLGLALAATVGLPLILIKTLPGGDLAKIVGSVVFALSCVALYAASVLFHATAGEAKSRWQRVDHCAIYLLIAGSYTPFALVSLGGLWGAGLLLGVWVMALVGMAREIRSKADKPPLVFYIALGWMVVAAALPLVARVETGGMLWLLVGAALYTLGTVFYVNRAGHRHAHGIWHLFVLGGTTSHFVAVVGFVL